MRPMEKIDQKEWKKATRFSKRNDGKAKPRKTLKQCVSAAEPTKVINNDKLKRKE